ncbi:MAG: hypothetical protein IT306_01810 [Chloroflexi bacterium]|nr:hypothetical protein [Chloroflexota bacterium]
MSCKREQGHARFDVATRRLIEEDPVSWLRLAGLPVNGPVHPVESEISTVLAEVDKLLRIDAPTPWLAHLEVQASRDPRLPSRLLQYHALLRHRHASPVESTVVLLRPEADGPELSGRLDLQGATDDLTISFWFRVVRIWERPVEEFLGGGLGILPLAPLAALPPGRLPEVLRRIEERMGDDLPRSTADEIWSSVSLLMGLRYDEEAIRDLLRRFPYMRESITYQIILEEGREEGREAGERQRAQRDILRLGAQRFGAPDAATVATIHQTTDLPALDRMMDGILRADDWADLLALAREA